MTNDRIKVRSGDWDIAYRSLGSGAETVLLLMGLGGRGTDWGEALPSALAEKYRVLIVDNRGTGASTKPERGSSVPAWKLDDFARDAVAVLDHAGVERAHVVGLSMGGMMTQLLALDHAARVQRIVLMSTHAGGSVEPRSPEILAAFMPPRGTPADEIIRNAMRLITAPGFADTRPDLVEELVRLAMAEPTPKLVFGAQLAAIFDADRSGRLGAVTAPTLVLHGRDDGLIPFAQGERLRSLIPGATLTAIDGCGHLPPWEKPAETIAAVLGHLAG